MTVTGWIPAEEMGITLTHEHIMIDWSGADSMVYGAWDQDSIILIVHPYLQEIKDLGCNTVIECTPSYMGRDPVVYRELSEKTGVNIIFSTGYYGAINNRFIPSHAWDETGEQLAARWLEEWEGGVHGTGIRPGIIKIAVFFDTTLTELHQKIVRAAALTHLESGLTIVAHTGPGERAYEQLEILEKEGVSPEAFVWTHALMGTKDDHVKIGKMGSWVSFDKIDTEQETIDFLIDVLIHMKENDLLNKVLLSHDAGWYNVGQPGGGDFRPYTPLFTHLVPAMKDAGFTEEEVEQVLVKNPAEAYTVKVRKI